MTQQKNFRLSVLIPTKSSRLDLASVTGLPLNARIERCVHSILSQPDPIGTEVLICSDRLTSGSSEHIEAVFGNWISQGVLRSISFPQLLTASQLKQKASDLAQGAYIAFLDPLDWWESGWLIEIAGYLSKDTDLLIGTSGNPTEHANWLECFILSNWATPSSVILRRTLFEEVGGFHSAFRSDYELWLLCIHHLFKKGLLDHLKVIPDHFIRHSTTLESFPIPAPVMKVQEKLHKASEWVSLLKVIPKFPPIYWSSLLKRLGVMKLPQNLETQQTFQRQKLEQTSRTGKNQ